ncbi:unnamed protein product [Mytilus coruscus]|uniref:C2H2-type domain-containing protein n=1 Tax=Mytilus coruscus TaxID=42192 RepID=A0A6J8CNY4_MYTCO|nr:unnamed protein product [Mytilus coruscus]
MAEILGNELIIESLRNDIKDLQWAISDIVSRVGPVEQPSWKFPDKNSGDIDINYLLELYDFDDEDSEGSQVAHIALYELVIDRFIYLVQTLSSFTKTMLNRAGEEITDSSSSSVGLAVKQYCNKQVQLQTVVQQTMSDIKTKNRKLSDLEANMKKLTEDFSTQSMTSASSHTSLISEGTVPSKFGNVTTGYLSPIKMEEIARDACSKNTQTVETAFVPCEACHVVQKSFKNAGDILINMCQAQKLPSSLQKYRPLVADVKWLSANDVIRWASEQNKDLAKLTKHMDSLMATINPLKEEIEQLEKKCKHLQKRVSEFDSDMRKEKEVQYALQKQFDIKIKDLEQSHNETVSIVTRQKNEILQDKQSLETEVSKLKTHLEQQQKLLIEIENTKLTLEKDLKENKANAISILQSEINQLQSKLSDVTQKLDVSSKELNKEQAKSRSASKHSQSVQNKQGSLLQRVDALDRENEELKDQVATLEEEKEVIEESLKSAKSQVDKLQRNVTEKENMIETVTREKTELEESITSLQQNINTLETRIQESADRERLMIEYPDLNGPVNPDLNGTGDIALDMENQVKANAIRIQVLEEQNEGLRNSITKVMSLQQGNLPKGHEKMTAPQQLWSTDNLDRVKDNHRTEDDHVWQPESSVYASEKTRPSSGYQNNSEKITNRAKYIATVKTQPQRDVNTPGDEFVVGKGRPPSASKRKDATGSRPNSGKTINTPVNTSSISAYLQLKKAGKLNMTDSPPKNKSFPTRPISGKPHRSPPVHNDDGEDYTRKTSYTCQNCDKMYSKPKDLDIHMSYCTG